MTDLKSYLEDKTCRINNTSVSECSINDNSVSECSINNIEQMDKCSVNDHSVTVCSLNEHSLFECSVKDHSVSECSVKDHSVSECSMNDNSVSECSMNDNSVSECSIHKRVLSECSMNAIDRTDEYSVSGTECQMLLNNSYETIDIAVLTNVSEPLNEELYENIYLPKINMNYTTFINKLYVSKNRYFSIYLFDDLYNKLNFSIINEILCTFEKKLSITRDTINPIIKIKLAKEFSNLCLSHQIKRAFFLQKKEFLSLTNNIERGKLNVNVTYKIYIHSLNMGINIIFRIILSNINMADCL